MAKTDWDYVLNKASEANWTPGLRKIFDYRDLGIKAGTKGNFVAHIIRANGKREEDAVQEWHVHDCDFQMAVVLNGWARFEWEGLGERKIEKGDCLLQPTGLKHREIECSEDFEILEIVSPAEFGTRVVEAPAAGAAE